MKKEYSFAFEVSDNIAQHGHMLPLLHASVNDSSLSVTLYANRKENISNLQKQYVECYKKKIPI
ncbi:hypothetical protein J9236_21620, partial [Providencia rettgeri]|uniref:hypothetical protein n=1 Tax=Providencia rettgeri TaxID=587 RepID=UPI001B3597E8